MAAIYNRQFVNAAPELVKRIRSGSHAAYELFYRMEFLNLVHFITSYLHDKEKAHDLAQETMLALWENRSRLDPDQNIRSFVFTIARNKALNELRRRNMFSHSAQTAQSLALLEDNSVEEQINALDLPSLIESVWSSLPEKIETTFALSRKEGLKNREIAVLQGISEKTVEYRIKVALKRFKNLFNYSI